MTLTCAIVDDEPLAVKLLETYVQKTPLLQHCGSYSSAVEAMSGLREHPVNILFLDIQMPELNGLEFAQMLDAETRIVFTTAFSQYAIDGYKVNAIDYLLKPISYTDFLAATHKAAEWFSRETGIAVPQPKEDTIPAATTDAFFIKSDYKILRIRFDDILYVEGLKDYVKIYLESTRKAVLSLTAMRAVESFLPTPTFQRIHRSFIVNMNKISVMERGQIVFGDKRLPISDSYKERIQEYINSHLLQGR